MTVIILVCAYAGLIGAVYLKQYRHILMLTACSSLLAGLYLVLQQAYVGGCVSALAGIASLCQFWLSGRKSPASALHRNGAALMFVVIAVSLLYSKPSDLLPCLAHLTNRFSEAQGSEQLIRLGLGISGLLWTCYGLDNGLYLFAAAEAGGMLAAFLAFMRSRKTPWFYAPATNKCPAHTTVRHPKQL